MSGAKETGIVFRSTGSWYDVKDSSGNTIKCNLKGKIRLEGIRSTNPIAVGDSVVFERTESGQGAIEKILDRKNFIARKSVQYVAHSFEAFNTYQKECAPRNFDASSSRGKETPVFFAFELLAPLFEQNTKTQIRSLKTQ